MRRHSSQHLTCSLELAWGEMECHPGKWQCPAANPAPEKGLTYANSPEQNAARMVWGKGAAGGAPRRQKGPEPSPPAPTSFPLRVTLLPGLWASLSPLHQQLLVTPTKQSRRIQLQTWSPAAMNSTTSTQSAQCVRSLAPRHVLRSISFSPPMCSYYPTEHGRKEMQGRDVTCSSAGNEARPDLALGA